MRTGARSAAAFGALVLIIMTLGLGGTASADPGNGQGAGQTNGNGSTASSSNGDGGNSANAHAENGPAASSSTTARSQEPAGASGKSSTKQSASQSKSSGKSSTTHSAKADHSKGNAGTSGTWNQRQPNSNADQNTGGANGQCANYEGVYCSTRNGSASENGNNVGKATGRPCAGCVGRADNKNPQGQKPDAKRDGNNGYECDGNNGIAKGNPAHTMCKPGDNVERCPDGSVRPSSGVCPTPPPRLCPDGSAMPAGGMSDCPKPPTSCPDGQQLVNGECVEIEPDVVTPPLPDIAGEEGFAPRPKPNAEVLGAEATADAPAVLPATGSSAGMSLMTGTGFLLLAAGAGLLLRRRLA